MLSIKPLNNAGNTAAYFFELEKYYVKDGVAENSRWLGKGAEEFNLSGNVDRETFSKFLNGEIPNQTPLGRIRNNKREHRPGIDLTFSAPKSVSILAYVLGHDAVIHDHEKAVTEALKFVQDNFAQARMKLDRFKKDIDFVHTQHLTAALFQHPTSRALDPQLHTHAIVMNMTKCPDDKYRSLSRGPVGQMIDAHAKGFLEQLFHNQRTVGAIYRGFLAHELFKRGAQIRMTHKDARFEVVGVSEQLIQTFSTRRHEIETALNKGGYSGARAAAWATVATNREKVSVDMDTLKATWQTNCQEADRQHHYFPYAQTALSKRHRPVFLGLSIDHIVGMTPQHAKNDPNTHKQAFFTFARRGRADTGEQTTHTKTHADGSQQGDPSKAIPETERERTELCDQILTYATAHLNEREASFTWQALLVGSIYYAKGHLSPRTIMHGIERWKEAEKLIGSSDIKGQEARLTTPQAMALENDTIFWMQRGQDTLSVSPLYERACLTQRFKDKAPNYFQPGQRAALGLISTSTHRVMGIQGHPGVGKTTMLAVAHDWIREAGYQAIGLAVSADAANTLADKTQMRAMTVHRFLSQFDGNKGNHPTQSTHSSNTTKQKMGLASERSAGASEPKSTRNQKTIHDKTILVLDEASLASTQQVNRLIHVCVEKNCRLVMVGDPNQLGAIEHGRPFDELLRVGMRSAQMSEIIRQTNPQLKAAVYDAAQQQMYASLYRLEQGKHLHAIESREERLATIAKTFASLTPEERTATKVATATRADRDVLNQYIRAALRERRQAKGKEINTHILQTKDLTLADKTLAQHYQKGDVVRFNRRYKRLHIDRGDYLTVLGVDTSTNTVTLERDLGGTIQWRPHKLAARQKGVIEVFEIKERQISAGDLIRFTRNDHRRRRLNGQLARVESVNLFGARVAFVKEDANTQAHPNNQQALPKTMKLSFARLRDFHWDHAYASTIYSLQGQTCQQILIDFPAVGAMLTHAKAFLTAISRAVEKAVIYTNDKAILLKQLEQYTGVKARAIDVKKDKVVSNEFKHKTPEREFCL